MSSPSLQHQYNYTRQLHETFDGNFSLDDLDIADAYFPKTKLHPFTFQWLRVQRELACTGKHDPQYKAVRLNYKGYLDRRISTLQPFLSKKEQTNPASGKLENNLWSESLQSADALSLEKLLEASLAIQDILFNCKEILFRIPAQAQAFGNELDSFIKATLPMYLNILPKLQETKKAEILKSFEDLRTALAENQIEKAKEQLTLVRKITGSGSPIDCA